jgi:16S rRNA (guanine527-N7)-methyltransferase
VEAHLARVLVDGAAALGVALDAAAVERFGAYLDLLLTWNRRIKLTSVDDPAEVVAKHFLDSLAVLPTLTGARTLVDVGAGAGFPGLPLAAVRADLAVTAVESIQKKAAFLEAVKRELRLPLVEVAPVRMEALIARGRRFDAAVSRATFAPPEWIERGTALVAPGGTLVAMVVPGPDTVPELLAPRWRDTFSSATLEPPYAPGRALLVLRDRHP